MFVCKDGQGYSFYMETPEMLDNNKIFKSYEEALEDGLLQGLKLIK